MQMAFKNTQIDYDEKHLSSFFTHSNNTIHFMMMMMCDVERSRDQRAFIKVIDIFIIQKLTREIIFAREVSEWEKEEIKVWNRERENFIRRLGGGNADGKFHAYILDP
jgi:hypothetical protein